MLKKFIILKLTVLISHLTWPEKFETIGGTRFTGFDIAKKVKERYITNQIFQILTFRMGNRNSYSTSAYLFML